MKNKILILSTILVIFLASFMFKGSITGYFVASETKENIVLGYCPTMEEHALKMAEKNWEILEFQNSAIVLQNLNNNDIDIALIGRIARNNEVNENIFEVRLREGFTLISSQRGFVEKSQLQNLRIHTNQPEEIVREYLPDSEIIYYNSLEEALQNRLGEIVFIDWNDYNDNELIIPIENNKKIEEFRIPTLYFYEESLLFYVP